jgi:hypothetical protein
MFLDAAPYSYRLRHIFQAALTPVDYDLKLHLMCLLDQGEVVTTGLAQEKKNKGKVPKGAPKDLQQKYIQLNQDLVARLDAAFAEFKPAPKKIRRRLQKDVEG